MPQPAELSVILKRIANGKHTETDLQTLQDLLNQGDRLPSLLQAGKYSVNIQQALGQVHIGDRLELTEENIQAIAQAIQAETSKSALTQPTKVASVDELVQQVRSRIRNDIQRLHGTMSLWGVDHWVPLGELFVDVNILEEVSSNRRSELDDLWQDFNQNPSYRGLDRMGLGKKRQRVSGLAVLNRNTNLMVVGKPGSGKTTYLQRVVTECNAGNLQARRIPVLIRLREFVEDGRKVGYSVERYLERYWRLSATEVQLVLDAGRSLVLLDGLDEVTGADRQTITKQIKRFARNYPQVQVIVTCRTQNQESRFERFDYVEIADFNELQVHSFTEHWFKTIAQNKVQALAKSNIFLEQLFQYRNKTIRDLATTPILLSLICSVFHQTGNFYSERSKLYEEGLELLLGVWDKSREIGRDEIYHGLSIERKFKLLSYLATKKFKQKQYVLFKQNEIEKYISDFLTIKHQGNNAILKSIESQHGLLIERAKKVWSFSHLSFQEYLVARWYYNHNNFRELSRYINSGHWYQVFILVTSMLNDSDELFLFMKKEVDQAVSSSKEFQKFLSMLNPLPLSNRIDYPVSIIKLYYLDLVIALVLDLRLISSRAFSRAVDLEVDYAFDPELAGLLKEAKKHSNNYRQWWANNGQQWENKLRRFIFKRHGINEKLRGFLLRNKEVLTMYYSANQRLSWCLLESSTSSDDVKITIQNELLLPISAIKKMKRKA